MNEQLYHQFMDEKTTSALFLMSLTVYLIELGLVIFIKREYAQKESIEDTMIEQLAMMIEQAGPGFLAIYSALYLMLLFLGKVFPFVMTLLITLQLLSVSVDVYILRKLKKEH